MSLVMVMSRPTRLDLLLRAVLCARTCLLRWLDETEATPVD